MSTTTREDETSKRIFYAGCFGLPWLWIVHALQWYGKQRSGASLLDEDGAMEVRLNEQMWVYRCRNSAFVVTFVWIVWVLLAQLLLVDILPVSWYVRYPEQGEYTGW